MRRRALEGGVGLLCGLLLVGSLARPDADDPGEALRDAAAAGDVARVKALLDAGTPIESGARHGQTALYYAADKGRLEVVRLLTPEARRLQACAGRYRAGAGEAQVQLRGDGLVLIAPGQPELRLLRWRRTASRARPARSRWPSTGGRDWWRGCA
jgi:hypothetical protein